MNKIYNYRNGLPPSGTIPVDRSTKYGNPFLLGRDGDRDTICNKYEKYIQQNPHLIVAAKKELKGKDLVCWCAPLRCHAETLLRIANE